MDIINAFNRAYIKFENNTLNVIYILIDIHGTVFPPLKDNKEDFTFYPYAKEVLKLFTTINYIKIILWTGSSYELINKMINIFNENDIIFNFINENPDIIKSDETNYLNLPKKFYFSIGIDDRFGFNPETDWKRIYEYLKNKGGI